MNATRLTIIALAAAAVMFSGCSTDNRVLSPGTDSQSETGINPLNRPGLDPRLELDSNESAPEQQHFVIVAKVQRIDIEGGCWYLQADDGNNYTPYSSEGLVLEAGLKLKAEGYIDENIQYFCGRGPVFVIEKYEIISKPDLRSSGKTAEYGFAKEEPALGDASSDFNTFEGIVDFTNEGCLLLETTAKDEFVLQHDMDILLKKGDHIRVTGYISALPYFTCYEAPVFNAETISVLQPPKERGKSEQPKDERAPSMSDDEDENDRFDRPLDDRRSQDDFENREEERKKKLEEEKRGQDKENDRP
ncbi:MAG: hypothetical protein JSW64_11200 [Candidatus Zixiibacteriota bacterium]|nr:MAG: hypothetical protein JSW64_11200 [candidate division Zixibacteria bacterium]